MIRIITLLMFICSFGQTTIYQNGFSQAELPGITVFDLDGDGTNWFYYTGGDLLGMNGQFFASYSAENPQDNIAIFPFNTGDNVNMVTTFTVNSSSEELFKETFGVYISDNDNPLDTELRVYTLTAGGPGAQILFEAPIPDSWSNKDVTLTIRHIPTLAQEFLVIDDLEVVGEQSLSVSSFEYIHTEGVGQEYVIYNDLGQKVSEGVLQKGQILQSKDRLLFVYFPQLNYSSKLPYYKVRNRIPEALCTSSNFAVYQMESGVYKYRIGNTWHTAFNWTHEVQLTYNACLQANQ